MAGLSVLLTPLQLSSDVSQIPHLVFCFPFISIITDSHHVYLNKSVHCLLQRAIKYEVSSNKKVNIKHDVAFHPLMFIFQFTLFMANVKEISLTSTSTISCNADLKQVSNLMASGLENQCDSY